MASAKVEEAMDMSSANFLQKLLQKASAAVPKRGREATGLTPESKRSARDFLDQKTDEHGREVIKDLSSVLASVAMDVGSTASDSQADSKNGGGRNQKPKG